MMALIYCVNTMACLIYQSIRCTLYLLYQDSKRTRWCVSIFWNRLGDANWSSATNNYCNNSGETWLIWLLCIGKCTNMYIIHTKTRIVIFSWMTKINIYWVWGKMYRERKRKQLTFFKINFCWRFLFKGFSFTYDDGDGTQLCIQ